MYYMSLKLFVPKFFTNYFTNVNSNTHIFNFDQNIIFSLLKSI